MKYEYASDLQELAEDISKKLFPHVIMDRVKCYRGYGTSSQGTIARCHTINKLVQKALGIKAYYILEFLSERFDKLPKEEQIKIIIHELMHIPKTFGGGFKHHDFVTNKNVNSHYKLYVNLKENEKNKTWF
ncbi:MAG: putative metallopeptidase [Candidatus Pacearchaeota archaeon]|jgi:predicted metallopeptidase